MLTQRKSFYPKFKKRRGCYATYSVLRAIREDFERRFLSSEMTHFSEANDTPE
jgi:hypothetical protein